MNPITAIIEEIKRDSTGAYVLKDWLGAGGTPVAQQLAEERAEICKTGYLGKQCPQMVEPGWWDRVKHKVADAIKSHIQIQNKVGLHVSNESELAMCRPCGCALRLKVWVPIEHISEHTSPETMLSFPPYCWQRNEIHKQTGQP